MPEPDKTIDLDRRLSVLEERMNTITESYDRGWKLLEAKMGEATAGMREDSARRDTEFAKLREDNAKLEAKMGEATAGMREDNARRDTEFVKLREDSAKRDRNMSIQVYAVAFGIVVVILGIGGTIISLLV
ncbi:MAG: hypothetical protein OXD45_02825 [Rhodobacteraceae bacterium]|nr:hypothetical protein [Paracoccaceae bacterium]